ncbi:MFS transporter [Rhizobium sp. BK376]|uniref:MFS transporter n=1 Tax=Rhizobium sp. BK376 TaxID=2512149 RepID=UPI0010D7ACCA|nr:MFS transporter [Rhizobium sp. BK376]TCR80876.1 putative MFS family arabinose efflux permease [Rhizobium sp. BK376]
MALLASQSKSPADDSYKWVALSNTTLGMLAAAINSSILLISLPAVFRGIGLKALDPGNINYLLWAIIGYMISVAVLVVAFGRLGDQFGRVKMYNLGFAVFTAASIALSLLPGQGDFAAMYLIGVRILQGVGGALIMANSTAILTDVFPAHQRGLALGINVVAAIGGQFVGLLIGGLLADSNWRLVFWINVPFGLVGTVWAYWKLREIPNRVSHRIDWTGNITFGLGLILILTAITYGIQPYGDQVMAWLSPKVLSLFGLGLVSLLIFIVAERRIEKPMLDFRLFQIPAFAYGNIANLTSAIARGGLQFMLIIWLQGIWLPLHGYSFEETPLWSAIFMLPLTAGFLLGGPIAGYFSDRIGGLPFAIGGMLLGAASFVALMVLPSDFSYLLFAALLFANGLGSGLFVAPNATQIMNSVPKRERGQASGMRATTTNAGQVLSIGLFFSLMLAGLAQELPQSMEAGLLARHVPADIARQVAATPPVASLFAAFLGYNPMGELIPASVLQSLPADSVAVLTGKSLFPALMSAPFKQGLFYAFSFSALLYIIAALCSWRGGSETADETAELTLDREEKASAAE